MRPFGYALGRAGRTATAPPHPVHTEWLLDCDFANHGIRPRIGAFDRVHTFTRNTSRYARSYTSDTSWEWVQIPAGVPELRGWRWTGGEWSRYSVGGQLLNVSLRGLFCEPAMTNLSPWPRKFNSWTLVNSPALAQDQVGFDGVANKAWTIADNATDKVCGVKYTATVSDWNYGVYAIFRVWIKKDTVTTRYPAITVELTGGTTNRKSYWHLNTQTGALTKRSDSVGTVDLNIFAKVVSEGDWWVVAVAAESNLTGNTTCTFGVYPADATTPGIPNTSAIGSVVVDQGELVYVLGLGPGAFLQCAPFLDGNGTIVANEADLYSVPHNGNRNKYNGSLLLEWAIPHAIESGVDTTYSILGMYPTGTGKIGTYQVSNSPARLAIFPTVYHNDFALIPNTIYKTSWRWADSQAEGVVNSTLSLGSRQVVFYNPNDPNNNPESMRLGVTYNVSDRQGPILIKRLRVAGKDLGLARILALHAENS